MTTLTALCTFVAVGILVIILSYIAMRGISALSLRFLIDTPRPVGEGGGIGNAYRSALRREFIFPNSAVGSLPASSVFWSTR